MWRRKNNSSGKYFIFLLALSFAACSQNKHTSETAVSYNIGKLRSFAYVNSDSLKYYDKILHGICNTEIPAQNALVKYADGLYYITLGIHDKALTNFTEAAEIFAKEKNEPFLSYCYLGTGNAYKLTGNSDKAIFYLQKALALLEKLDDRFFITVANVNLAETYQQKDDIPDAQRFLLRAKENEPYGTKIYVSLLHLQANLYGMAGRTDSALQTDAAGIALAQKNNFPDWLSAFYDNIAQCFTEMKKYDSAEYYCRKCISIDSATGRLQLVADSYTTLVNIYGYKKEEEKMKATAARAYRLCDSTQYMRGKYAVFEGLNNYYNGAGKWQQAAETKDSLLEIYKRLINEESEAKTAEYNVAFETSRKEQLIILQKNKLQKAGYLTALIGAVAMLLAFIIVALYRSYRAKRIAAVSAARQEEKDSNVQAVFESEQAERIRIARDLHDSIGQKLSVLKMYITGRKSDDEKIPALLDDMIQEVRNISHNLLPEELNFGFRKALESDIDKIKGACSFAVHTEIEDADYSLISTPVALNVLRVFRELLANAVKHSGGTEIYINVYGAGNKFVLQLKDNGRGIKKESVTESTGIGWKNIFTRINMVKGTIDIKSNEPAGSIITINIPFA